MYFNCILKVWYYLKKYQFVLNPYIFSSVTDCLIIRMLEMDHFESAWPVRKVFRKTECFEKKYRKLSKFTSNKNHERNLFSQKVGNQLPEVVYEKFLKNVLQNFTKLTEKLRCRVSFSHSYRPRAQRHCRSSHRSCSIKKVFFKIL